MASARHPSISVMGRPAAPLLATVLLLFFPAIARGALRGTTEPLPSRDAVHAAVAAGADAAVASLRPATEGGGLVAKCDYHLTQGIWYDYERLWHTAVTINALVAARDVLGSNRSDLVAVAVRAGQWWTEQQIHHPTSLAGLMNSTDVLPTAVGCITDACNGTQDLGDVSDSAYGIYALSAATSDRAYSDAASDSALWQLHHMAVGPAHPGLYWNLLNKTSTPPGPITTVPQPFRTQIEGSLFLQGAYTNNSHHNLISRHISHRLLVIAAYKHTKDEQLKEGFLQQAEATVRNQDQHGLWMLWYEFRISFKMMNFALIAMNFVSRTPNDNVTGTIHPRFNLWYAHSLLDAFEFTGNVSYLEAATKTAVFYSTSVQRRDGTIYYDSKVVRFPIEKS